MFYHPGKNSRKTVCIFCCNELRILCYKHRYLFAPYFPVPIRLFYVSALCTGSHTYHKSGSCKTISHADGANPYYDQCRFGITDLEDSLIPKSIIIDTPSRTVSFHIRDITYIEIINKELQIHLQDGTVTKIYKSLSAVREILPKDIFVQCHRCYIVSLYAVRSIRRFEITLNNQEIIPVSKYSYRDVQEQLQQYAAKWF